LDVTQGLFVTSNFICCYSHLFQLLDIFGIIHNSLYQVLASFTFSSTRIGSRDENDAYVTLLKQMIDFHKNVFECYATGCQFSLKHFNFLHSRLTTMLTQYRMT
jgi:hypothetical protein